MPEISFATFHNLSIYEQLRIEEALLRADDNNWCLFNYGSAPSIVMGISGKAELLIDSERLKATPIPVVKRFSGGGTVVVDEHTIFVTLICNTGCTNVPSFPEQVMRWNSSHYEELFPDGYFTLLENDYTVNNRKFGGNAQYLTKNRWVHHSTLLWDFQNKNMDYLLMPDKMPLYREKRSHKEFLCRLKDHLSSPKNIQDHILAALEKRFNLREASTDSVKTILQRPHRTSTQLIRRSD